jgi:hypothetical protein
MTTNAGNISEAASQKPRRGRPPLLTPETVAVWNSLDPGMTNRTWHNWHYKFRAQGLLDGDPECLWLIDMANAKAGKRGCYRHTLLAELGRIPNDADLIEVARSVCTMKPTTKQGVAMIRGWRLGREPGDWRGLLLAIAHTHDEYRALHPRVTWQDARDALAAFARIIDECEAETNGER